MINPFKKRQQRKAAAAAAASNQGGPTDYGAFPSSSKLPPRPGLFIAAASAAPALHARRTVHVSNAACRSDNCSRRNSHSSQASTMSSHPPPTFVSRSSCPTSRVDSRCSERRMDRSSRPTPCGLICVLNALVRAPPTSPSARASPTTSTSSPKTRRMPLSNS